MKKVIFVSFCFLLLAACAASEKKAQNTVLTNRNPGTVESAKTPDTPKLSPAQAVKFSVVKPVEIKAGSQAEADLQIKIQVPFHVNSNPPSEKGFIPLAIALENSGGITAGAPVYPKGEPKTFAFNPDKPLSVYAGEVVIKLPLKADKTAATGTHQLSGKLMFQPCDEEVCYRPQTVEITLPLTVN